MANNEAIACHNFFHFRTIPKNSPISIEDCYFSNCQKLRNVDSRAHCVLRDSVAIFAR